MAAKLHVHGQSVFVPVSAAGQKCPGWETWASPDKAGAISPCKRARHWLPVPRFRRSDAYRLSLASYTSASRSTISRRTRPCLASDRPHAALLGTKARSKAT